MFPRTAASAVIVSNLCEGGWEPCVSEIAKTIRDPDARVLCLGLLQRFKDCFVNRPFHGGWPGDESIAWAQEALGSSHSVEVIDRIVACDSVRDQLSPKNGSLRDLSEVDDNGFWNGIESQSLLPLNVGKQVKRLRKILLHSDFLVLISPYIRNRDNDETDFACALIESAFQRPKGWEVPEIEIHTSDPNEGPETLENVAQHTATGLRKFLPDGQKVKLVFRPKFLDRFLIGGVNTKSSKGEKMRIPRWGISMSHVARNKDDGANTTLWSLLIPKLLGDEFNRHRLDNTQTYFVKFPN